MPAEARQSSKLIASRREIKRLMTGFGYWEAVNYSFIDESAVDRLRLVPEDPRRDVVHILNPLSEDQAVMRTSLVPGLLETMARNLAWQTKNLRLFEIGRTYMAGGADSPARETEMLGALWTGSRFDASWQTRGDAAGDFFDIKGTVEGLLNGLGITGGQYTAEPAKSCRYTRPGHTARVSVADTPLGLLGEVHPQVLANFGLKQTAFIFECRMETLVALIPDIRSYRPIPKYPAVARDVTLIVDSRIEAMGVLDQVVSQEEALVENLHLLDVYQGAPIPEGRKSISFRIIYRSPDQTLEDQVVTALHKKITGRLVQAFDAGLPA
jgi:phenylalanyl-tRNA synthetase beta chain